VTDILRDEELLPLFRKAGLVHVSLGTEAAAQLKLDRFNKETTIEQNKKAIQLLKPERHRHRGAVHRRARERDRRDARGDLQDGAGLEARHGQLGLYTPWPFSDLFQELGDKVEVRDFEKYNFVTPIMKPDAMDRGELLDRVMSNYRRFFMNKAFLQYPFTKDKERRKYLMGCLKAFAKSGFERKFYDLGRVGYWGPQTKKTVNFSFDQNRRIAPEVAEALTHVDDGWVTMHGPKIEMRRRKGEETFAEAEAAMACGGGTEQLAESLEHAQAVPMACGGGKDQLPESLEDAAAAGKAQPVAAP
jgi:anaerobic magnesium-protoporphyrin IX monomethyl ester cyclase